MARQTKIVNLSLPFDIYQDMDEFARQKGISRSGLLRVALRHYVASEKLWHRIYQWGDESARQLDIKDEADVDRVVHDFRKEHTPP
jgi:predicted transcriptional regulator